MGRESQHYSELIFTEHRPGLLCVQTAKKQWGNGRTAQREGLYQKKLSTTTAIKEAAREHTTWAAAKVKWKHFLFAAIAPKDNKRCFHRAKWGAAGTPFLDGKCPAPIFPKLHALGRQQVTLPTCAFEAHARTPCRTAAAASGGHRAGEPPTTMVTMEVA